MQYLREQRFGKAEKFRFHNPGLLDFDDVESFFEAKFVSAPHRDVIVSSEGLESAATKFDLNFLFAAFDQIRVYLVLRPKPLYLESHFFQRIKTGAYREDLKALLESGKIDPGNQARYQYAELYRCWADLVGAENIRLLFLGPRFEAVETQFLKALLGDVPDDFVFPERQNEALGIVPLAAIATLRHRAADVADHWHDSRRIISTAKRLGLTERKSVLLPEILDEVSARFAADDEAFAAMQDVITLDDLRPDLTDRTMTATDLACVRETEDYARLRDAVKERFDLLI